MKNAAPAVRPWLPIFESQVRTRLNDLQKRIDENDIVFEQLRFLANHDLSQRDLEKLGSFAGKNFDVLSTQGFEAFVLGITSNASMKLLANLLVGLGLGHGVLLQLRFSDFDQAYQLSQNAEDPFFSDRFDGVLHAGFSEGLKFPHDGFVDIGQTSSLLASLSARLDAEIEGLGKNSSAPVFLQNLVPADDRLFGNADRFVAGSRNHSLRLYNEHIEALCAENAAKLIDVQHLAAKLGLDNWTDQRNWNLAKMPLQSVAMISYCDLLARTFSATKGKSRRALILDLDNTLWGGVIGDDGMDGIVLGQGSPDGEAFQEIQSVAKALSKRGVVLSVCSKNTDQIAIEPFRSHPEMVLQESDIAVFVANWQDKASNIRMIAETLSLGLDSFVFLDDNPAERQQVRNELPLVLVPEVSGEPSDMAKTLLAGNFFELPELSDADRERSGQYAANAKRLKLQSSSSDMSSYLQSLEMGADFEPFEVANIKRITQLINKSNQFNLTTRRYTEDEVIDVMNGKSSKTGFSVRLRDKFGDNGIIAVVILDRDGAKSLELKNGALIDSWLMSCRVLGRQVEEYIVNRLVQFALSNQIEYLVGEYQATPRNGIVSELYPRLGFEKTNHDSLMTLKVSKEIRLQTEIQST